MDVIPLTLTISLCLAFTFVLFFALEQKRRRFSSTESDSLLPLSSEVRVIAMPATPPARARTGCGKPTCRHQTCDRHPASDAAHAS